MTEQGQVPEECPACAARLAEAAPQCPSCGRVFGEANRCPDCRAITGVRSAEDGYRCLACGGVRERVAGTVVVQTSAPVLKTHAARGSAVGLRAFGIASIGGGVFAAVLAASLIPGAGGVATAVVLGLLGASIGTVSLRAGARLRARMDADRRASRQRAIVELAERCDGRLTATGTARQLGLPLAEADAELTRMTDGARVTAELTEDGVVEYVFHEMRASGRPAVRVLAEETDEPGAHPDEAELPVPGDDARRRRRGGNR